MTAPSRDIRIGTLVKGDRPDVGHAIRSLLPHGFECFQITFWRTLGGVDLERLADEVMAAIDGCDVEISALGCYGNSIGDDALGQETWKGIEALVEHAPLFRTKVVACFTGRLVDRPLRAVAARRRGTVRSPARSSRPERHRHRLRELPDGRGLADAAISTSPMIRAPGSSCSTPCRSRMRASNGSPATSSST